MGMFDGIVSAITSPIASLAGSLIGAGASAFGQSQANQANADLAQSQNQFSAQQFATRYQTTVKDLQAAGLNPMLAYGVTPNAPSAIGIPTQQNKYAGMADAGTKAIGAANMAAQTQLTDAQTTESISRTGVNDEQRKNLDADTKLKILEAPNVSQRLKNLIQEEMLIDARKTATHAQEAATRMDTLIRKTGDLPEAESKGKYHKTTPYNPYMLKDTLSGVNSAVNAVGALKGTSYLPSQGTYTYGK